VRDWTSNPRYGSASAMRREWGGDGGKRDLGGRGLKERKGMNQGGKGGQFEDLVGRKTWGRNYGPLGGVNMAGKRERGPTTN